MEKQLIVINVKEIAIILVIVGFLVLVDVQFLVLLADVKSVVVIKSFIIEINIIIHMKK
jgi:hypothetical protein